MLVNNPSVSMTTILCCIEYYLHAHQSSKVSYCIERKVIPIHLSFTPNRIVFNSKDITRELRSHLSEQMGIILHWIQIYTSYGSLIITRT